MYCISCLLRAVKVRVDKRVGRGAHLLQGVAVLRKRAAASVERDKQLAPAIVQAFYAAAPANAYIVKQWTQLKGYVRDMAHDGLDVTGDPVLAASSPPSKDLVS